ncbi:MAG: DUF2164 domain-containing protein, partial [Pseudomonadota bacterium]
MDFESIILIFLRNIGYAVQLLRKKRILLGESSEMPINLDDDQKTAFLRDLQVHFQEEFDEPLSEFRAEAVLSLALKTLAPAVYNQAVQDVRAHLQVKLDDLDGE